MTALWGHAGRYQDWATFLERWGAGENIDPAGLPALRREDFTGDSWERLATRLVDALDRRLRLWAQALARAIADAKDEFELGRALSQARSGLRTMRTLVGFPGLTAELTGQLNQMLDRGVVSAQQSLERQAWDLLRTGMPRQAVEARLRAIRDNSLTVPTAASGFGVPGGTGWYADPSTAKRRRVITDPPSRDA